MADLDKLCLLSKVSDTSLLTKFLHECIDDLVETKKANFDNFISSDIQWTREDYDSARVAVQNFFSQSVIEDNLILEPLKLGKNVEETILNCFEIRKNGIFQALAKTAILKNGNTLVENIDWKLKWVLGSSDLATIRDPLLQVQLHCCRNRDEKCEKNTVDFEANLEQVDHLIRELSDIKRHLQE
ncbi:COMM domain-containing protein 8 [Leptinotarsa decemlineata]|uniref:COMM domain-containing protein 8 n=1 Tax=Leptinotarsa decemlineata TaxID=7539 RepID=UPI000C253E6A|nr:uncharacterized protein LOC111514587 [Leptinotarsa decemlineata]